MTKQIALVQLYIGWIEKGYKIVEEGLTTIGEIKNGEFNLHSVFFSSLSTVNPEIKKYSKVALIISDGFFISRNLNQLLSVKPLNPAEMKAIQAVSTGLIDACSQALDELTAILSDNQYQMNDEERINKINRLYADMEERVVFTRKASDETHLLLLQRQVEANDIESIQNLN